MSDFQTNSGQSGAHRPGSRYRVPRYGVTQGWIAGEAFSLALLSRVSASEHCHCLLQGVLIADVAREHHE